MLHEYDLTVVADPDQPDEYVMVPPDHPVVGELSAGGAKLCGVEIMGMSGLSAIRFGVSAGPDTRRLVYWWADWHRVAEAQRSRGSEADAEPCSSAQAEGRKLFTDQSSFAVRFDWGEHGLRAVGPGAAVIVVVDVLSFGTCVDIAVGHGATVLPYRWRDDTALPFAQKQQAVLADGHRAVDRFSLSPTSLVGIPAGTRLVLPSPNGAAISLLAAEFGTTVAACLRNAAAVAEFARSHGGPVAVIACGERWSDGSLRLAWEDLVGAGAVIAGLLGPLSPEAEAAYAAFKHAEADLPARLRACASGRELIERGFADDVELAAAVAASACVPVLSGGAFVAWFDSASRRLPH